MINGLGKPSSELQINFGVLQIDSENSASGSPTSDGVVTLKTRRQKVPGSNPGNSCRPSRLEFSVVFSETRVNTGPDPLERLPTEGTLPIGPGPISGQLAFNLQPTNQPLNIKTQQMYVLPVVTEESFKKRFRFPLIFLKETQLSNHLSKPSVYPPDKYYDQ